MNNQLTPFVKHRKHLKQLRHNSKSVKIKQIKKNLQKHKTTKTITKP